MKQCKREGQGHLAQLHIVTIAQQNKVCNVHNLDLTDIKFYMYLCLLKISLW